MIKYVLICLTIFVAGFVDAIAGGGGLISLPAYMIGGLSPHAAIATNKMSSSMGTTVSFLHYAKQGYLRWNICLPGIATAFIGSWCGAKLNLFISEKMLSIFMLVLLPLIACYVLKNKKLSRSAAAPFSQRKTILLCCAISLCIGMYDGIYGPGTGTFLMLLFTAVCRLSLEDAAGTTKAINLTTNIAALSVYLLHGSVMLPLGLAAGACNMIGNFFGSRCFSQKGAAFVRPIMLIVLFVFFIRVITDLLGA